MIYAACRACYNEALTTQKKDAHHERFFPVTAERLQSLNITHLTRPCQERKYQAMPSIPLIRKTFKSSSLTLRDALQKEGYVIHRDPEVGCIFVASAKDGYMVSFSDNPNTQIKYTTSKKRRIPYIVANDRDFYRTYADLEKYLQPSSNQRGWETVPVISDRKEVRA